MKERKRKAIAVALLALTLLFSAARINSAEPRIRIVQNVDVSNQLLSNQVRDENGKMTWAIGDVSRVGPGGYAPLTYCVENKDEQISLKGYYVTFILDPEKTMGYIDWVKVKEEANGPTGYRWSFSDNVKYCTSNTYILALMGNYAKTVYNAFTVKDAKKIDLNVVLGITEEEPNDPTFFGKFLEESIFGVTMEIPDLEPTTRSGKHSWCVEEGIYLSWYQRLKNLQGITSKHVYPKPYLVVGNDAVIGEKHKIVALVCSADPDSMWQWSSFNVISYEEVEFIIEKPQVSQTILIGFFIAFMALGWYSGLFKKIGRIL